MKMFTRTDTMKEKPLISVVIPIYNGEEYLDAIYNNFISQTYDSWEVLFVNDLSIDKTLEIISGYSRIDSRFRVLNRETKGGTAVKGIEYALPYCKGDYFFFMSHDDFMENTFLERCVQRALETEADTVIPNLILFWDKEKQIKHGKYPLDDNYQSTISPREAFYLSLEWDLHSNVFRKMDLVRSVGYSAEYYNSCEFYGRKMFLYSNKIVFCDTNFYYRQSNPNAITKNFHYFQIDILTTDIMLFEIMHEEKYDKVLQRKRLKTITESCFKWTKTCLRTEMSNEERKYMKRSLLKAGSKILKFWLAVW